MIVMVIRSMNIELENLEKDFEERQDEFISLLLNRKKIMNSPNYKITTYKKRYKNNLLISSVYLIIVLVLYLPMIIIKKEKLLEGTNLWVFIIWIMIFLLFILTLRNSYKYNKNLQEKKKASIKDKKVFIMTKSKVELESKEEQSVSINWDNIERVIIGQYGILFLTKNENTISIGIPIWYKEEVMEIIEKYNKEYLLINRVKEK